MINFPDAPTASQIFTAAGLSWQWDGVKWVPYSGTTGPYLPIAGGTMTGLLTLSGPPTANLHAATKLYVDNAVLPLAPLASPVFTGDPRAPTPATADNDTSIATTAFVKAQAYVTGGPYLPLSGGTLTGNLIAPRLTLSAAASYVYFANATGSVNAAGGSFIYGDGGYVVVHLGAGGTFYVQDSAGNNRLSVDPTGSTLTGALHVNGAANVIGEGLGVSGGIYTTGDVYGGRFVDAADGTYFIDPASTNSAKLAGNITLGGNYLYPANSTGTISAAGGGSFYYGDGSNCVLRTSSSGAIYFYDASNSSKFQFNTTGGSAGAAYKPGGGTWTDISDIRTKEDVTAYERGLAAVLALRPVTYRKSGRWRDGITYTGLVADEAEVVMPEMVGHIEEKLDPDDAAPTDIKTLDASALTYALVNAVKELSARVMALEGKK